MIDNSGIEPSGILSTLAHLFIMSFRGGKFSDKFAWTLDAINIHYPLLFFAFARTIPAFVAVTARVAENGTRAKFLETLLA